MIQYLFPFLLICGLSNLIGSTQKVIQFQMFSTQKLVLVARRKERDIIILKFWNYSLALLKYFTMHLCWCWWRGGLERLYPGSLDPFFCIGGGGGGRGILQWRGWLLIILALRFLWHDIECNTQAHTYYGAFYRWEFEVIIWIFRWEPLK